jgi:hypothetical protein
LTHRGQEILQRDDEEGAYDRPEQGAEATHQRHENDFSRHRPVDIGQGGKLKDQRLGRARKPGERGRQHEGDELEALGLVAE